MINLIQKDKFDIISRCSQTKGDMISDLVIQNSAKLCVEIGVFKGSSLMYFYEALAQTGGKVIAIDPYDIDNFQFETGDVSKDKLYFKILVGEQSILDGIYSELESVIYENELDSVIQLVRAKSENYYTNIQWETIDILHIDGNPNFSEVTKDILFYLSLVRKSGHIIIGSPNWPGVVQACHLYLSKYCDLVTQHAHYLVFKKR